MRQPLSSSPDASPVWCPDRGDGTYCNPVLFADYSDPDAIRVGSDYWLTSSSFGHVPGLPILHSTDLVNWSLVNHALPRLVPIEHFSTPRHGGGVWAPTLRFHEGRFWIFYPDPDFGIYAVTASDPRGRWSDPVMILRGKGVIDPCPFWDEDGTGYLIHAWARSRSGIHNRLTLCRLRRDNLAVEDAGEAVIDGEQLSGHHTIEGPKLYRRGGYYYVFAPAGGVATGYQAVFRARDLRGPYEHRVVLAQGSTPINGPHQGAWVDTPAGTDWFLHFQELPAYGRVVHLQPMRWQDDWPIMGTAVVDGAACGQPVSTHAKPGCRAALPDPAETACAVGSDGPALHRAPQTSDEFALPTLGLQWQWQANPKPDWLSLEANRGSLRLRCIAHSGTLWSAGHLLMQKFPAPMFEATTVLKLSPVADGDTAGLVVFGYSYAWLGVRFGASGSRLVLRRADDAYEHSAEREIWNQPINREPVYLRVTIQSGAMCQFAYSTDGGAYTPISEMFAARSSKWVGAKVGVFASSAEGAAAAGGHADFDWFRVTPISP